MKTWKTRQSFSLQKAVPECVDAPRNDDNAAGFRDNRMAAADRRSQSLEEIRTMSDFNQKLSSITYNPE
jgi:hypothetical protein